MPDGSGLLAAEEDAGQLPRIRRGGTGNVFRVTDVLPGLPSPLGATPRDGGTNFAVASGIAEAVELCLLDEAGAETRVRLPEYNYGVFHGFLPGVGPGQAYGYRVHGPWDPAGGLRCNPAKLLLDPYARAVHGEVTFGPEVIDYDAADPNAPSSLDSAGHVPRGIVADGTFAWGDDEPPRRAYSDTILYEAHVKGLTMRHPDVPGPLRGTYAGLAHEAVTGHLTRLGVTAVELLPVHQHVPEEFLLQRGLYWQDNEISWFDWSAVDSGLLAFTARLAAFRRSHPVFRRRRFLTGAETSELGWFTPAGTPMTDGDWSDPNALALGVYLDGSDDPDPAPDGSLLLDDDFLVLVNAWWEPLDFTIPPTPPGQAWQPEIDSYDPDRTAGATGPAQRRAGDRVTAGPRSVCVLRGPRPGDHGHSG